jgi:hypothetical protein
MAPGADDVPAPVAPRRGCHMTGEADERGTGEVLATVPSTDDAVSASVVCARALGLPADDPQVIAEGYGVRVRLSPAAVVTRVVTLGRELRPAPRPWLEREVAVAQFLAASGTPIVPAWDDPGPRRGARGVLVALGRSRCHDGVSRRLRTNAGTAARCTGVLPR